MGHEAQSTTNLGSSAVWTTNSPAAVVVNGQYTVTNPVSGSDPLLVTNVEAGTISVFDDGESFLGNLQDPSGQDIVLIGISGHNYDPIRAGVAADLVVVRGPIEPVLQRIDPLLTTRISLSNDEFLCLVDFVRNGLLDKHAQPEQLRRLVPQSVPSSRPGLVFQFEDRPATK
jgi:hypothetical protein